MMDESIVNEVLHDDEFEHPKFYQQIFRLLEDMRVFNHIRNERPSTSKLIDLRLQTRLSYTESQIKFYKTKTVYTDLLFLYLEKAFLSQNFFDIPMMHSQLDDILNSMFQYLPNFFQNETSEDNMYLAQRIMFQIDDMLTKDMLNEYYHLPRRVYEAIHEMTFDELKRTDASNVDGKDNTSEDTDSETAEAETNAQDSKSEGGAYLEMELHEGENSEVISDNDTAREGDSTDDMTDMMTKKGRGSDNTLNNDEGGSIGENTSFALKGINENVEIKWNVPDIEPDYLLEYQNVKTMFNLKLRI